MGVRHREWKATQEAEERELMAEALEDQERLEKTIKAELIYNTRIYKLDLLDQVNTL